jgi:diguanylate cyclase (GGDEF)-like protein
VLLKAIAQAIRRACRSRDLVYRYGGDEFSLVLPDTTLAGAIDVAQRVRMAIREVRGEGRRRPAIRCSVGVATFPDDGTRRADLILAADRALYAAKRAGRDRVATTADGLALADDFVPPSTPVEEALLPSLA